MALIKCTECGREISDRASGCPSCGAPINNTSEFVTPNLVPPANVFVNLKHFNEHLTAVCSSCGYNGMMGVKEKIVPWYATYWTIGFVLVVLAAFGGAGFFIALVLGLIRGMTSRTLVVCPSCGTEQITK